MTDKTGTLTEPHSSFLKPLDVLGAVDDHVLARSGSPAATRPVTSSTARSGLQRRPRKRDGANWVVLDRLPFDHERQLASALVVFADTI